MLGSLYYAYMFNKRRSVLRNVLSLFNGISGLHLALDKANIQVENVYYSEIDKFANKVTEHHYPNDIALGDVTKWEEWDIDWSTIDLVSAGFPCFVAGSSVLTKDGYKNIEDVQMGDLVMSHTNQWREVVDLFHKKNHVWTVKAQGVLLTETTEEHPYYVSKMTRVNGKRTFTKPDWVEVKDLTKDHFVCFPKITGNNNPLNLTKEECYIIGRYIADGHTAKQKRTEIGRENQRFYQVILSVGSHKIPNITMKHTLHQHTENTHRMIFSNKRLTEIVEKYCGCGAINKHIHPNFLELPKDLLDEVVKGLLDGDGSEKGGVYKLTSVSKELVMSLNLAVMRLYGVVGNITKTLRPNKTYICGREVNQKDTYTLSFTKEVRKQKKYHETGTHFLAPIKEVVKTGEVKDVYNIEVAVDNSYTVNNAVVHNCQAWSTAGKQLGDKDERGMLFWTTLDIIKTVLEHNPKAKFLMENVKMKKEFEEYITYHTEQALGYVEKTLINSALVSAQNRNRYYWTNFKIEQPQDKGILLRDILDGEPRDIYNELKQDIKNGIVLSEQNLNGESQTLDRAIKNGKSGNSKSNSLTACAYKGMGTNGMTNVLVSGGKTDTFSDVQKDNVVVRATVQANAEHTYNGKTPTLTASMGMGGGNVPLYTDKETAEKYKGRYIDKHERPCYRKLTPLECERLQTVPDNWTSMLSNTQRYKSLGNGWTIDVIAHILKCI